MACAGLRTAQPPLRSAAGLTQDIPQTPLRTLPAPHCLATFHRHQRSATWRAKSLGNHHFDLGYKRYAYANPRSGCTTFGRAATTIVVEFEQSFLGLVEYLPIFAPME